MDQMWMIAVVVIVVFAGYILYLYGHFSVRAKRSVVFIGNGIGRRRGYASFVGCDGWIRRMIRFEQNRVYEFRLDTKLKYGTVSVELLNRKKETVMRLTENIEIGRVEVKSRERYCLIVHFVQAEGSYVLDWE